MLSTLRLFKALPVSRHTGHAYVDRDLAKLTLSGGFIFAPELTGEYPREQLITWINQLYARNPEHLNASFHKSFAKVRDASIAQLVLEQLLHYVTTYGAEAAGVFGHDGVFLPAEELNAPQLEDGLRLVFIRALTKSELKVELLKLLSSGVALAEQTVEDVVEVAKFIGLTEIDLMEIRNKEVRAALYDHLGIVPTNPEEFLRFIVFKATGKTLLIKNAALINTLKTRDNADLEQYFKYPGLKGLATIFYRYKPIFLALRTTPELKRYVNRIRRLAVKHHQPMQEDFLNSLTAKIKRKQLVTIGELNEALQGVNTFRKIRLAYALKFRTTDADSILYRIRNGKSYAKEFSFDKSRQGVVGIAYEYVMDSIAEDIRPNVHGKSVYIPKGLSYGLPATEKQFTGTLPSGTFAEAPASKLWTPADDMVVGVHWENLPNYRVDLDLSISNAGGKIGWDGRYRDNQQGIHFSGDVTDAPKAKGGATEVFHISAQARGSWLVNLNYYNGWGGGHPVPFQIVVGRESRENINLNYVIDPNKLIAMSNSVIESGQKTLGVITATDEGIRFYFAESAFTSNISSRHTEAAEQARKFLLSYYTDSIILNDVLESAGAVLVDSPEEADIDLSYEAIDKTSILNLLTPQKVLATA